MCIDPVKDLAGIDGGTILQDGTGVSALVKHFGEDGFEAMLKPEYRGHPIEFYNDIQSFHDYKHFWTDTGLSESGKREVINLKERWPVVKPSSEADVE